MVGASAAAPATDMDAFTVVNRCFCWHLSSALLRWRAYHYDVVAAEHYGADLLDVHRVAYLLGVAHVEVDVLVEPFEDASEGPAAPHLDKHSLADASL